ncbi:MAG TPA: hypothetical protein VEJ86_08515 [Candidatus Binataceae bacterium]|nr:hypothetical protein [Candidatus Binataceae bacterium]
MRWSIAAIAVISFAFPISPASAGGPPFKNSDFKGDYALVLNGSDASCAGAPCPISITGQIDANGNGKITSGSISLNESGIGCTLVLSSSTYSFSKDGTGTITLTAGTDDIECATGESPLTTLGLTATLFDSGDQAVLASATTSPDKVVVAGTAASQNKL